MNSLLFIHSKKPSDSLLEIRRQVYCEEEGRNESAITDALLSREEHIYVQEENTREAVGAVSFSILPGNELKELFDCSVVVDHELTGTIGKLMLTKDHRGKPFLAVSLMILAYEYLVRKKAKKIIIAVYASRRNVVSMYERLGFTRLPPPSRPPGKILLYLEVEPGYSLSLRRRCFSCVGGHRCIGIPYQRPLELEEVGEGMSNVASIVKAGKEGKIFPLDS